MNRRPQTALALTAALLTGLSSATFAATPTEPTAKRAIPRIPVLRRPVGPHRAENIRDDEVRQIQAVVQAAAPGAIVNISAVIAGCPCEEGPDCFDQVWVVTQREGRSEGLSLTRTSKGWDLGKVQQWQWRYRALQAELPRRRADGETNAALQARRRAYEAEQARLLAEAPSCETPPGP